MLCCRDRHAEFAPLPVVNLVGAVANRPAVTQDRVTSAEVDLAYDRKVACSVGKAPGPAAEMGFIIRDREQSLSDEDAVYCRLIKVQRLTVVGHPVVLNGNGGEVWASAENLHAERSFEVSGGDSQSGWTTVNHTKAAEIGEDCASHRSAGLGKAGRGEQSDEYSDTEATSNRIHGILLD